MRKAITVLAGGALLVGCTQTPTGWVSAGVGPLSTDAQVSYYQGAALVKQDVLAAGGGSSYDFRGSVGTLTCIQITRNQQTVAYRVPIETTVLMAIVISETNGQLKVEGNARYTVASSCP
ncbi:hypothetical protein [Deinococcus sp. YIM 77859]|uniref:hypothetical protein n=1 Tax=Deinococcus sp. YIM 77859 TaxID=1540221 RepID=UPI000558E688|nr:hypothetical protein [Deinococcus sp. YIM 77859]